MPQTIKYIDGNWNEVASEETAAYRLVITTNDDGVETMRRREAVGSRKGRQTFSTDPRAGAIMREGNHAPPMSRPNGD